MKRVMIAFSLVLWANAAQAGNIKTLLTKSIDHKVTIKITNQYLGFPGQDVLKVEGFAAGGSYAPLDSTISVMDILRGKEWNGSRDEYDLDEATAQQMLSFLKGRPGSAIVISVNDAGVFDVDFSLDGGADSSDLSTTIKTALKSQASHK